MGGIEHWMDEEYVMDAFEDVGHHPDKVTTHTISTRLYGLSLPPFL